jgi:hypothetical protein
MISTGLFAFTGDWKTKRSLMVLAPAAGVAGGCVGGSLRGGGAADKDPTAKRPEGEETVQHVERHSVEDLDVGPGTGAGAHDEIGVAVAVDVADRHGHTAGVAAVGRQPEAQRAVGVVDEHRRGSAGARAGREQDRT